MMASVSRCERQVIGQRTKEGLAQAHAAGKQIGSPVLLPQEVESRIVAERLRGSTLAAIARRLNDDLVPLPGSGSSAVLRRVKAD